MDFWDNMDINKNRESETPYHKNTTLIQFNRSMQREGKTLTTYTSGQQFQAFFRIKKAGDKQTESIIMYYDITAPVRPGTLVMYDYGVFLALNRETVGNDVYYKSTLVKCKGIFNEISGHGVMNVPFYTENMKSSVSIGNQVLSMLNGNLELLTEENALTKRIQINHEFVEFGRTFKITNKYVMDGIVHLIAEVESDKTSNYQYSIVIDGVPDSGVKIGKVIPLAATPYINGCVTTGGMFEWSSDNQSIATVNSKGRVRLISEGTVQITVLWVETNVKEQCTIHVVKDSEIPRLSASISGISNLKVGCARTYTITIKDSTSNNVTDSTDYSWNIADCSFLRSIQQTASENQIKLLVEDEQLIGKIFTLQATSKNEVIGSINIKIIDVV